MYFLADWDLVLKKEIKNIDHRFFYLHAADIGVRDTNIKIDCSDSFKNFTKKNF